MFKFLKHHEASFIIEFSIMSDLCIACYPRGGTQKFSVYIGEADFFGVKILNFRIFLGFQKNWLFFWVVSFLWIFFWGHAFSELFFWVIYNSK